MPFGLGPVRCDFNRVLNVDRFTIRQAGAAKTLNDKKAANRVDTIWHYIGRQVFVLLKKRSAQR